MNADGSSPGTPPPSVTETAAAAAGTAAAAPAAPRKPRRRWLTYLLIGGAAAAALAAVGIERRRAGHAELPDPPPAGGVVEPLPAPEPPLPPKPSVITPAAQRPRVELVFALDTTGSMGGLLEGAKRKIWSLASFVARGQPTPDLRVGLVAYRDIGDRYVTRVHDLDDDLDRVYRRLRAFEADGGGDTPEHVARALSEAVNRMSWTEDDRVAKIIYVVGDAPPHTDYEDGFDLMAAARAAAARKIQVHTIRCGDDPTTAVAWRRVAELGKGQFLTIHQDGGMREARTPFDDELARLHDELSATAVGYGAEASGLAAARAMAAAAPMESKAERAAFLASKRKAVGGKGDLVDDVSSGRVRLDAVEEEALPADLRALDRDARRTRLGELEGRRKELSAKISEVSKKRQHYLEREAEADKARGGADGFDSVAKGALRKSVNEGRYGFTL